MRSADAAAARQRAIAAVPLAAVLVSAGVGLFVTGVLFGFSPASLESAGFGPNPSALRRVLGVGFFGGTGVGLLAMAYGLLRSWPFFWRRFTHAIGVISVAAAGFIWESPDSWTIFGPVLIACGLSLVLYLSLRRGLPENMRTPR